MLSKPDNMFLHVIKQLFVRSYDIDMQETCLADWCVVRVSVLLTADVPGSRQYVFMVCTYCLVKPCSGLVHGRPSERW